MNDTTSAQEQRTENQLTTVLEELARLNATIEAIQVTQTAQHNGHDSHASPNRAPEPRPR